MSKQIQAKTQKVREEVMPFLKVFASKFKTLLESARERYEEPLEEEEINSILFPIKSVTVQVSPGKETTETIGDCEGRELVRWITKRPPSLLQIPLKLDEKMSPSPDHEQISPETIDLHFVDIPKKDLERNVSLGVPKEFKMFADLKGDFFTFISFSSRVLDILATTTFDKKKIQEMRRLVEGIQLASSSYMRDVAKGLFFNILHDIPATPLKTLLETIKNDLVFKMFLQSKEKAMKAEEELRTREKNELKARYREMSDTRRELVKMLVDVGISEFIVTNEDRRRFAQEFDRKIEVEYDEMMQPEGDFERDYVENGDQPVDVMGNTLEVDFGNYGERAVLNYDDYTAVQAFDEE